MSTPIEWKEIVSDAAFYVRYIGENRATIRDNQIKEIIDDLIQPKVDELESIKKNDTPVLKNRADSKVKQKITYGLIAIAALLGIGAASVHFAKLPGPLSLDLAASAVSVGVCGIVGSLYSPSLQQKPAEFPKRKYEELLRSVQKNPQIIESGRITQEMQRIFQEYLLASGAKDAESIREEIEQNFSPVVPRVPQVSYIPPPKAPSFAAEDLDRSDRTDRRAKKEEVKRRKREEMVGDLCRLLKRPGQRELFRSVIEE